MTTILALSYETLQNYWWLLISILGAAFVMLTFVQGGQTMVGKLATNEEEKSLIYNAIGRRWDLTFTMLVVFGGAFFASFPLFYSTSFGGAYWVWILILFSFIIQAVSYEYRTKAGNFLGQKTYETFLFINGLLATILIGAAVGTFFTGSHFIIEKVNIVETGKAVSTWTKPTHGLEAIWATFNGYPSFIVNLSLGLAVFFLSRVLGAMYIMYSVDNKDVTERAQKALKLESILFLVFFLLFVGLILTKEGFAYKIGQNGEVEVYLERFKYLHNLIQMPLTLIIFLVGVVLVLYGIFKATFKGSEQAFWVTAPGVLLAVMSLFFLAGYNNTAFYPSVDDLNSSLTIRTASASHFTLNVMAWVSLLVPFIIAYIWYAWHSLTRKKVSKDDLENDTMSY